MILRYSWLGAMFTMLIHRDIHRICGYPYNHNGEKYWAINPKGYKTPYADRVYCGSRDGPGRALPIALATCRVRRFRR